MFFIKLAVYIRRIKMKKDLHILISNSLFDKIQSEAKMTGASVNKTIEDLLAKAFKKKDNDYKEFIELLDKRDRDIVSFLKEQSDQNLKNINDALIHFFELTQTATEAKNGDDYAKRFFDRMSKL